MLYDPKWQKQVETKLDPLSLDAFIAWLEKQPGETEYDWYNYHYCIVGRFVTSVRKTLPFEERVCRLGGPNYWSVGPWRNDVGLPRPWTYAAALDRARKLRDARG